MQRELIDFTIEHDIVKVSAETMGSRKKTVKETAEVAQVAVPKLGKQVKRKAGSATETTTSESEAPVAKGRTVPGSSSAGSTSTGRQGSTAPEPPATPVPVPTRQVIMSSGGSGSDGPTSTASDPTGKAAGKSASRSRGGDWNPSLQDTRASPYAGKGQGQGPRGGQWGKGAGKGNQGGGKDRNKGSRTDDEASWNTGQWWQSRGGNWRW